MGSTGGVEIWAASAEDGGTVSLCAAGNVVVVDGPQALVEQLIAADPVLNARQPSNSGSEAMVGALAGLASVLTAVPGIGPGGGQQLFALDAKSLEAFKRGALSISPGGELRLFQRGEGGEFMRHGSLTPVDLDPSALMSAQLAMATMALMAALNDVQRAVENVQSTVDLLRDHIEAERIGGIAGLNKKLHRVADEVAESGSLSQVGWDEVSASATQVEQHLATVRAFIQKRMAAAEAEGQSIDDRVSAVELLGQLAEALTLLVVAEDNQFVYEQLRLQRVRDTDPDRFEAALKRATGALDAQAAADRKLIDDVRGMTEVRVGVRDLEIHRVFSERKLIEASSRIDDQLKDFAEQRSIEYVEIEIPDRPTVNDAVDELRERGGQVASQAREGGRQLRDGAVSLIRRRRGESDDDIPGLEPGSEAIAELPEVDERPVAYMIDPEAGRGSRFSGLRDNAADRARRLRRRDDSGGES